MCESERAIDWLRTNTPAEANRHTGRSLLDHLIGTYRLLDAWGAPQYVQLAGLFHSVYGTVHFKPTAVRLTRRAEVRNVIGRPAERLAYLFCALDRPKVLLEMWDSGEPITYPHDRFLGMRQIVSRDALLDLLEIEAANLLEQGASNYALINRLSSTVSPVAARACEAYIGKMAAK